MIAIERAAELAAEVTSLAKGAGFPDDMEMEVCEDMDNLHVSVRSAGRVWTITFPKRYQINDRREPGKDFSTDEGRFFYGLAEALGGLKEEITRGRPPC